VYWPHGVPFGPLKLKLTTDFWLPFRPYSERMKWIR
jgi:signal peptidase I